MRKDEYKLLRKELQILEEKVAVMEFDDENYDIVIDRISDIQKILNSDTEVKERRKERVGKLVSGFFKTMALGGLYLLATDMTLDTEKERPVLSKALSIPKEIIKLDK